MVARRVIDLARNGVIDEAALRDRVLLEARAKGSLFLNRRENPGTEGTIYHGAAGRRPSPLLTSASYLDRAVEYDRLAKKATEALEKRRHENWAAFYRYMAQEVAKREQVELGLRAKR